MRVLAEFHRDAAPAGTATPRRTCSTSPSSRRSCAPTSPGTRRVTLRGNAEVTGARPRTAPGTFASTSPTAPPASAETGARRTTSSAATAPTASPAPRSAPRMQDLKFEQRWLVVDVATAADLGRVGRRAPGLRHPCARRPTCASATPATAGSSGSAPGETADDYRDIARLHPLISPWTGTRTGRRAATSSAWPSTPSAPRSPTAGATGGCSCSATPPTSPRRSSDRAWAPGCATRPTSPGNSPASSRRPARKRPGHLRDRTQAARPRHDPAGEAGRSGHDRRRRARQPPPPRPRATAAPRPRPQAARPGRRDPPAAPLRPGGPTSAAPKAGRAAVPEPAPRRRPPLRRRRRRPVRDRHHNRADRGPTRRHRTARRRPAGGPHGTELHRWLRRGRARAAIVRPDGTVLRAGRNLDALSGALPGAPRPGPARHSENPDVRTSDRANPPPPSGSGPTSRKTCPPAPTAGSDTCIPSFGH